MEDYMTAISITIEDLGVKKRDFEIEGKVYFKNQQLEIDDLTEHLIISYSKLQGSHNV